MQFSQFEKPMFRVAFEGDTKEVVALLDFIRFCYTEDVRNKLDTHPLGPSHVWRAWADETYVGFSTSRLMLQSGHRFGPALATQAPSRLPWKRDKFDINEEIEKFKRFYPSFQRPAAHETLFGAHPAAYLRAAEAVTFSPTTAPRRMLEIGAGNGVHVAFRQLMNPDMRTVVVDLPESVCAGYLLLRTVGINVALPHEDAEATVTMRLPFQPISGTFDFAFNMSSFQEMELDTVNHYLRSIHERLERGGVLQHINFEQSKQLPDNRPEAYEMSGFEIDQAIETPYHSSLDRDNPLVCVIARRL